MDELNGCTVTVTIPLFDSSRFIDDCLNGLLKQTYAPSEIIFVIDNRTTDNSEEILKRRMNEFGSLRIVKQNDRKGLAGARNIGIKEAKSDVIWFLDVDDMPHPTFLEELLSVMMETDADTVICNHFQSFKREMGIAPEKNYSFVVRDGKYAVEHYTDYPIYSWSRIQKKSVFNENSIFREHPAAEDIEQTIRQYSVSNKVCYYNKPLFTYVKRKSSSSKKKS